MTAEVEVPAPETVGGPTDVRRWKRYPAYKDAGVPWLGDVPAHWEVRRIRHVLLRNDGGVWGEDHDGIIDTDGTIVLRSTDMAVDGSWTIVDPARRRLSLSEQRAARLATGDLVITKSSGSPSHLGKTAIVTRDIEARGCCFSNFMQRLRLSRDNSPRFVYYLLNSRLGREQLNFFGSTTTGLANLNAGVIGRLSLAMPPLAEQRAITAFLDNETGKIDVLVQKKRRLIELLQEKRAALISHAVTRGLEPSAPMKDSGVPWLGEVPGHWQVRRLKFLAQVRSGVAKGRDLGERDVAELPYLRVANVQDGYLNLGDVATITVGVDEVERFSLRRGDVLMNEGGDNDKLGRGSVWEAAVEPCLHQNHVFAVRPQHVSDSYWISLLTLSSYAKHYFMVRAKQSTNLASISATNVKEFPALVPPEAERRAILAYLDGETAKIDRLTGKVRQHIGMLGEYRTALISAAVTGKIDVRGEADGVMA